MHHVHPDAMGRRVDPWLVRTGSNLEGHRDQTPIVSDVVAYTKLLMFRRVCDGLEDSSTRSFGIVSRMGHFDNEISGGRRKKHKNTCQCAQHRLSVFPRCGKENKILISPKKDTPAPLNATVGRKRYLTVQMYGLFPSVFANFTDETGTPRSCNINLGSRLPTRDPASDANAETRTQDRHQRHKIIMIKR